MYVYNTVARVRAQIQVELWSLEPMGTVRIEVVNEVRERRVEQIKTRTKCVAFNDSAETELTRAFAEE